MLSKSPFPVLGIAGVTAVVMLVTAGPTHLRLAHELGVAVITNHLDSRPSVATSLGSFALGFLLAVAGPVIFPGAIRLRDGLGNKPLTTLWTLLL
jgi:hypothetical protein